MTAKTICDWLTAWGETDNLVSRAHRLLSLERLYANCVPEALARASTVTNLRDGTLVLCAHNGAVASKLRQMSPSLLEQVRTINQDITKIQIVVQATSRTHSAKVAAKPNLAPDGVRQFEVLAESLPESDLKTAVARLVARQKRQVR